MHASIRTEIQAKRCNNIELGGRGHASFFAMSLTGWLFFLKNPVLYHIMPHYAISIYQHIPTISYHIIPPILLYVYIRVYILYIYTSICRYIYIYIHTYMHACMHACMHAQYIQDISSHHISTINSPYSDSISTSTILWISDWITPSPSMIHPPEAENLLRVAQGTSDRASCV